MRIWMKVKWNSKLPWSSCYLLVSLSPDLPHGFQPGWSWGQRGISCHTAHTPVCHTPHRPATHRQIAGSLSAQCSSLPDQVPIWGVYSVIAASLNQVIIASGSGLSTVGCQGITWTNALNSCQLSLAGKFQLNSNKDATNLLSIKKMYLNILFAKSWPFCSHPRPVKSPIF